MMDTQSSQQTILIVDDEPILTELFSDILSEYYDVRLASTALEAQQVCCSNDIALIISDYHLGMQNSDHLFEWVIAQQPGLAKRFILLTGDQLSDLSSFEGIATILYKPVAIDVLLHTVKTLLRGTDA
ncbi:MAG: hypothetical protein Q9M10_00330 [Mariprofundaceae bacterium]|nr:hypothetical protein [Mariprofundaceae bacterium]